MISKGDNSKNNSQQPEMTKFKSVNIHLEFCRGINYLKHSFNFEAKKLFVIYAPNGSMKSSFANTLHDISIRVEPTDYLVEHETICNITNERREQLKPDNIIVVNSINNKFEGKEYAKIILDEQKRKRYQKIIGDLENHKATFFNKIAKLSGYNKDNCEKQILKDFNIKNLTHLIKTLASDECFNQFDKKSKNTESEYFKYKEYEEIKYQDIFNDATKNILETKDFGNMIAQYITKYDTLIENSKFLTTGFDDYNIKDVKKNLDSNNLFTAGHSLCLNYDSTDNKQNLTNSGEFADLIKNEVAIIEKDKELSKIFKNIEKDFLSHQKARELRRILRRKKFIIRKLGDIKFRTHIWKNYFCIHRESYITLLDSITNSEQQMITIRREIESEFEQNKWQTVLNTFKSRFSFPYIITIENRTDAVLYDKVMPEIRFRPKKNEGIEYKQERIIKTLSSGESRALYILDLIYKLEIKKDEDKDNTLVILDDIVESFDYKNKYAMIQYVREFSQKFNVIALTHNFDFFRGLARNQASTLRVKKTNDNIELETYSIDSIPKWFKNLNGDDKKLISAIPALRNILDMLDRENTKILSFIHYKPNTEELTMQDLKKEFDVVIKKPTIETDNGKYLKRLSEIITEYSESNDDSLSFKLILSITIRICTEKFLMKKLNNSKACNISKMFKKCNELKLLDNSEKTFIDKILLIVNDYIHLNAFMYEPLMDIDVSELIDLYKEINKVLNTNDWKLC